MSDNGNPGGKKTPSFRSYSNHKLGPCLCPSRVVPFSKILRSSRSTNFAACYFPQLFGQEVHEAQCALLRLPNAPDSTIPAGYFLLWQRSDWTPTAGPGFGVIVSGVETGERCVDEGWGIGRRMTGETVRWQKGKRRRRKADPLGCPIREQREKKRWKIQKSRCIQKCDLVSKSTDVIGTLWRDLRIPSFPRIAFIHFWHMSSFFSAWIIYFICHTASIFLPPPEKLPPFCMTWLYVGL